MRSALATGPGASAGAAAPSRARLYAAMLVATLCWGALPVAAKALVGTVGAPQQTFVRALSAFVVLGLVSLLVSGRDGIRGAVSRPTDILVQGLLSFLGSSLTNLLSLQFISASLSAVLVSTFPVILAFAALGRGATARALLGSLVALAGIAAVVGGDDPAGALAGGTDPRGVALALLTAAIIAASQRWGQRTARRGDPLAVTASAAGAMLPPLIALVALGSGFAQIVDAPRSAQLLLLFIGVFCTALNFGLWFWALKYVSATRAAPLQYLSTPISVLMAWYFLGEPLTLGLAVGTALVLGGVVMTQSRRRRSPTG